jgi:hypothetical protein
MRASDPRAIPAGDDQILVNGTVSPATETDVGFG